ncbi:hypothetical protein MHBO_004920 [Bonamia ostreae]|uniref:Uncharacterized protein n=1 Tax=Bonamia ostreae TaxID=126728 RepID=A0ABV2AUM3_9EUKA
MDEVKGYDEKEDELEENNIKKTKDQKKKGQGIYFHNNLHPMSFFNLNEYTIVYPTPKKKCTNFTFYRVW